MTKTVARQVRQHARMHPAGLFASMRRIDRGDYMVTVIWRHRYVKLRSRHAWNAFCQEIKKLGGNP